MDEDYTRLHELRAEHPDWNDAEVCLVYMREQRTGERHVGADPRGVEETGWS